MNNTQFRNLLLSESSPKSHSQNSAESSLSSTSSPHNHATSTAAPLLGSRARSSIPMTPRSVGGHSGSNDFVRQVAEHKRATLGGGQPPSKKLRVSAPKGSRLAAGYQDRAALLRKQDVEAEGGTGSGNGKDDKAERIKALEEMVKLQQIDQATFEKLRDEMGVGGEVGSTHLVKGLDWRLLQRVKRGEDVMTTATEEEDAATNKADEEDGKDVEQELENLLEKEVQTAKREETVKKGVKAPPPSSAGSSGKLSRNEILTRLKASRAAAAKEVIGTKSAESALSSRFRKVGSGSLSEKKKFIETVGGRRREILVITNADGTSKRKARWLDKKGSETEASTAPAAGEALGMEVPVDIAAKHKAMLEKQRLEDAEVDDIFAGVGADYNPLGADVDEPSDDSHSAAADETAAVQEVTDTTNSAQTGGKPRNYFHASSIDEESVNSPNGPIADPNILAALKRAAAIRKAQEGAGNAATTAASDTSLHGKDFIERLRKREREDAADLDLGFGESRFGDEEDEDGPIWEGEEGEKKSGRKRGPKKRKGNKDEMSDMMAVLERGKR
jgi:RED-like protein N-terminal region